MKAKHTPGPWFTVREGFSAVYVEARIEGGMLQEVAMCGPTEAGPSQQEANAALIAAAPDLLEALRVLLSLHEVRGVTRRMERLYGRSTRCHCQSYRRLP